MNSGNIPIIILAAGASVRLGQPKQLLLYKNTTLIKHAIQSALESGVGKVIVVVGASGEAILKEIEQQDVQVLVNEHWQEGMASGIRLGLQHLAIVAPSAKAAIFMVCDQPFVTAHLLKNILEQYRITGQPIVASSYKNILGTPALFDQSIFPLLQQLQGDTGAKKILTAHPQLVAAVNFAQGDVDIDTTADYQQLTAGSAE